MRIPLRAVKAIINSLLPGSAGWIWYATLVCFIYFPLQIHAQTGCPVPKVRKYVSGQRTASLLGWVDNETLAADANPVTFSTLNAPIPLLGLTFATQYLRFNSQVAAGTPLSVKIIYPTNLLGAGSSATVQPFVYDNGTEKAAGVSSSVGNLLSLLNGAGDMELTFTPKDAAGNPVAYDGVWIKLSGIAGLAMNMGVYDAWIMQDPPGDISCDQAIDVLAGIRAGGVNLLSATGGVVNKWNAIDNDPSLSTYAQLNTGVQVLSQVFETVVFNTPAKAGDSVYLVLQDPGGGLLDLSLLTGFTIQPYLGTTPAGSPITNSSSLLSLRLLSGPGQKYVLAAAIPAAFDRVDIQMGGVVGALSSLRIYDVKVVSPVPVYSLTINGNLTPGPICIKDADKLKFNITNADPCAVYKWYSTDNTLLSTGNDYTPVITSPGNFTWYVEAIRNGCSSVVSNRVPVHVTVEPRPGKPLLTIQLNP
ncbi:MULTISPECIES: immunoglobulin domain-containing protein [unclassified Chitinophaga]|uniref:immunoglobulin domain-containing protein n=1 Tax=unclassified Chitinophaga TaxID=2619133 RepID=UPI00300F7F55